MLRFFRSLRGKLILTYTFVTVLALLALEIVVLVAGVFVFSLLDIDRRDYLADIQLVLYLNANGYLEPGQEDLSGLQAWLAERYASGRASDDPYGYLDSPAALIVPGSDMFVLAGDGTVVAEAPARAEASLIGRPYSPPEVPGAAQLLEMAQGGASDPNLLYVRLPSGNYLVMVPVPQPSGSAVVVAGIIVVTVAPEPALIFTVWPLLLGAVVVTAILLLAAVAPFAALFGFIMSRGLTGRLGALAAAADAWSEGDFSRFPHDRAQDEIGNLGRRLRHMAERIQSLLQTQNELAALQERNRLARELHDTVKQQSFATLMQVRAARNLLAQPPESADPATVARHLAGAEALIKTSQGELGRLIAELRPAALEGQGLAAALRAYAETWAAHSRIPATVQVQNERALPLETEQALYRVAQEALANVARHSRASAVGLRLAYAPGAVRLVVQDNGVGFDPAMAEAAEGFGLLSMRQRLAALGGLLVVESGPSGTTVTAATDG